ncbi:hypothetical protein DYB25_009778 [Aphanomyces astaci]|uniref:Serine protease n=1 Tax=Aphanomyces astaci TaxID=112090 RepID=A0A397AZ45_APHAT|nr:hypothetical protein DYB25_009778 [Aphanomyces astaci]RHY48328.1 hypothetical protein DYB34_011212 [Aphanomyces astaci]
MVAVSAFVSFLSLAASAVSAFQCQSAPVIGADELVLLTSNVYTPFSYQLNRPDAAYLSLHFASVNIPVGGLLTISSPDGSQFHEYTNVTQTNFYAEFIDGDSAFITYTPPRSSLIDSLLANDAPNAFLIDKFAHGFPKADLDSQVEAICGKDDSQSAVCLKTSDAPKYQKAQAVARLRINGRSLCTGWLFGSEGHLITNNHCIRNANDASNTQYEFGAECTTCETVPGGTCTGVTVATSSELLYTNPANDFTLVKLKLANGASLASYGYLQARASGPVLGEPIYIAQHPGGKPKRIATIVDSGAVGTIESISIPSCVADEVGYTLDTEGGSSGSPVLSAKDNAVVALHNCGGCLNGGVKISKVIKDLTAANLVPKDALAGGSTSAPITTTVTPVTTSAAPVTTSAAPVTTSVAPVTTKSPVTPTPTGPVSDCNGCKGCYSKVLVACFPLGYTQAQCASFTGFQTIWCGN